jgi:hypothetical protein
MYIHTDEIIKNRGLEKGGKAQKYVDSEVLRYCDPFVPFRTGDLKRSGILGTKIGSGEVRYDIKYARKNYYENGGNGTEGLNRGGSRGRLWFKRMKIKFLGVIKDGIKKICRR